MSDTRAGRNDPCPCGSGKKFKHCCLQRQASGYALESYSVRQPRQVPHDGATLRLDAAPARNGDPRSDMPAIRVGVEYEFDEPFGKAFVSYSFSVGKTIVLESGNVTWVEFLQPGMRFKLEDGGVATVTKVETPKLVMPPEDKTSEGGAKLKRVLGTIKRTGFVVLDVIAGNQTHHDFAGAPVLLGDSSGMGRRENFRSEVLELPRGSYGSPGGQQAAAYGTIEMYNLEVEDFHTFYVGRRGNRCRSCPQRNRGAVQHREASWPGRSRPTLGRRPISHREGRCEGKVVGTSRNPHAPTVEEFNPRIGELNAGDIGGAIKGRKHGIFPDQAESVGQDVQRRTTPLPARRPDQRRHSGRRVQHHGRHHRLNEIIRRVEAGTLPKDTKIRILFHD